MGYRLIYTVVITFFILGTIYVRLQYIDLPLERDEGEYAYIAWRITEGTPPYLSAYTMKLPLVHILYALTFKILGTSAVSARFLLMAVNLASGLLLFHIAKHYCNARIALLSLGLFLLYSALPTMHGLSANTEHFVVFFVLAGVAVFTSSQHKGALLLSGLCFGLAILSKQTAVIFALLPLILLKKGVGGRHHSEGDIAVRVRYLTIGTTLPLAIYYLVAIGYGTVDTTLFWTAKYPFLYANQVHLTDGLMQLIRVLIYFVFTTGITPFALLTVGLFVCCTRQTRHVRIFALTFFAISCLSIVPGYYFRPHYFILSIPSVSIISGIAISQIYSSCPKKNPLIRTASLLLCALILAAPAIINIELFKGVPTKEYMKMLYGTNPFHSSKDIANVVNKNSRPEDTIAIIGSEPQMYFYSKRRASTKYLYMYPLGENHDYRLKMQHELISDIVSEAPKIIIVANYLDSWSTGHTLATEVIEWANTYIESSYEPIYSIDYDSGDTAPTKRKYSISLENEKSDVIVLKRIKS